MRAFLWEKNIDWMEEKVSNFMIKKWGEEESK